MNVIYLVLLGLTQVSFSNRSICSVKKLQTPFERISPHFLRQLMLAKLLHIDPVLGWAIG